MAQTRLLLPRRPPTAATATAATSAAAASAAAPATATEPPPRSHPPRSLTHLGTAQTLESNMEALGYPVLLLFLFLAQAASRRRGWAAHSFPDRLVFFFRDSHARCIGWRTGEPGA